MLRALRQPKWIIATVVVAVLAAVFVRLGIWQLDRLEQRQLQNTIGEQRLGAEPVELSELLDQTAGDDLDSLEYRRAAIVGEYDVSEEVLIRSQVELGRAGFHVITPLVFDEGRAVLVNRGWVPLEMDTPPVDAPAPRATVEVDGWIHLSENRPSFGPEDPPGDLDVFNRVDVARIGDQLPYAVAPVFLVATGEGSGELPITVDPPDFGNEGPHLAYAIQWFGFAAVGVIGFYFLLRRNGSEST
jgi:surfeit locus 1 family protein